MHTVVSDSHAITRINQDAFAIDEPDRIVGNIGTRSPKGVDARDLGSTGSGRSVRSSVVSIGFPDFVAGDCRTCAVISYAGFAGVMDFAIQNLAVGAIQGDSTDLGVFNLKR